MTKSALSVVFGVLIMMLACGSTPREHILEQSGEGPQDKQLASSQEEFAEHLKDCNFDSSEAWAKACAESDCSSPCCEVGCGDGDDGSGGGGCPPLCMPVGCQMLDGKCPSKACQTLTDCGGVERCYPPFNGERPACGEMSYYGQDVPCCDGLEQRCGEVGSDGQCEAEQGGYQGFPQCVPCGNGACDTPFENACNCPEDCS